MSNVLTQFLSELQQAKDTVKFFKNGEQVSPDDFPVLAVAVYHHLTSKIDYWYEELGAQDMTGAQWDVLKQCAEQKLSFETIGSNTRIFSYLESEKVYLLHRCDAPRCYLLNIDKKTVFLTMPFQNSFLFYSGIKNGVEKEATTWVRNMSNSYLRTADPGWFPLRMVFNYWVTITPSSSTGIGLLAGKVNVEKVNERCEVRLFSLEDLCGSHITRTMRKESAISKGVDDWLQTRLFEYCKKFLSVHFVETIYSVEVIIDHEANVSINVALNTHVPPPQPRKKVTQWAWASAPFLTQRYSLPDHSVEFIFLPDDVASQIFEQFLFESPKLTPHQWRVLFTLWEKEQTHTIERNMYYPNPDGPLFMNVRPGSFTFNPNKNGSYIEVKLPDTTLVYKVCFMSKSIELTEKKLLNPNSSETPKAPEPSETPKAPEPSETIEESMADETFRQSVNTTAASIDDLKEIGRKLCYHDYKPTPYEWAVLTAAHERGLSFQFKKVWIRGMNEKVTEVSVAFELGAAPRYRVFVWVGEKKYWVLTLILEEGRVRRHGNVRELLDSGSL